MLQKSQSTDPIDTAARQAGAFRALSMTVRTLSARGTFADDSQISMEELALINQYHQARLDAEKRLSALVGEGPDRRLRYQRATQPYESLYAPATMVPWPHLQEMREARESGDEDRYQAAMNPSAFTQDVKIGVGVGSFFLLVGLTVLVVVARGMGQASAKARAMREDDFNRRTDGGVLVFSSFDQAEAHRTRRTQHALGGMGLIILMFFGLGVSGAGTLILWWAARQLGWA